jgi:hypothetical protein
MIIHHFPYRYCRYFIRYSLNFDTLPTTGSGTNTPFSTFTYFDYFASFTYPPVYLALADSSLLAFFSLRVSSSFSSCSSLPPSRSSANDTRFFFLSAWTGEAVSLAGRTPSDLVDGLIVLSAVTVGGREAVGLMPMMCLRWYWMRSCDSLSDSLDLPDFYDYSPYSSSSDCYKDASLSTPAF